MTSIEWVRGADGGQGETWNPIAGCSVVPPGCTNCYAMRMADRLQFMSATQFPQYQGTTRRVNGNPVWTGALSRAPEATLLKPLRRRKPTTYFVNSMSDLFHEAVPDAWIDQVFAVMGRCPQHTFQVLTKRAARMRAYMSELRDSGRWMTWKWEEGGHIWDAATARFERAFSNVWLGVSVERQEEADARVPDLLATSAAVRFVSAEPLLGPVDLTRFSMPDPMADGLTTVNALVINTFYGGLDWVIVGGESGPGARPMHPDWARAIRDQCNAAGVAFFFKQWGAWTPDDEGAPVDWRNRPSGWMCLGSDGVTRDGYAGGREQFMRLEGKSRAGRLLDGREWNEMPIFRQNGEAA